MSRQPVLFVSHGSPMLPLEPGSGGAMLEALGGELAAAPPRAVLALSPHWMVRGAAVGASPRPATIHDFGGFDPALQTLRYPAPGDPELARDLAGRLGAAGWNVALDPTRGLDHGIWVPLLFLLPEARVPVVPLAMPWPLDAAGALRLGAACAELADDGVLLLGSGSLTHNLHEFSGDSTVDSTPEPYVLEFVDWFDRTLQAGDIDALLAYRRLAPHAVRAHPTDEHLLPLFWAVGAAGARLPRRRPGGVHYGMLAMDTWTWM